MAKDYGNRFSTATEITVGSIPQTLRNTIGLKRDRTDFLKFQITGKSQFRASLSGLRANADLALFNSQVQVVRQSRRRGRQPEQLNTTLEAGTYFLRVKPGRSQDQTGYNLQFSATSLNIAPTVSTNISIALLRGTSATLNNTTLQATDPEQTTGQLVYTVTTLPKAGQLRLNGNGVSLGSTFTQADIDSGLLSYTHIQGIQQLTQNNFEEGFEDTDFPNTEIDANFNAAFLGFQVSGNFVAWSGFDGNDYEVFLYDGITTRQLTNNAQEDLVFGLDGTKVVWQGKGGSDGGSDYEIFFYNGTATQQLTANTTEDSIPQISGSNVVWFGTGGSDRGLDNEIFFFNGTSTRQLTTNFNNEFLPRISGSNVVWDGFGGSDGGSDEEIFFFDGTSTRQLTLNTVGDSFPSVSGSNVVWEGVKPGGGIDVFDDREIFFFNGSTTTQLTNNNTSDAFPKVFGSNVFWVGKGGSDGGSDREVFWFDGSITRQLTTNADFEDTAQISGLNIVWSGDGGFDRGTDGEIFLYSNAVTQQLTTNNTEDRLPSISGLNVVWLGTGGSDGGSDREIFFTTLEPQDNFSFTLTDGAGGTTSGTFNLTIT